MKKTHIILAAVLCTAPVMTIVGCRTNGARTDDQALDDDHVEDMDPVNAPKEQPTDPAPTPAPSPQPAENPEAVDENNDELARMRAELAELRRQSGSAPVDSSIPTAQADSDSSGPEIVEEDEPQTVQGMLTKPEYVAVGYLRRGVKITLPLLQGFWKEDIPRENYVAVAMSRRGDRIRVMEFDPLDGATHRSGKTPVDSNDAILPFENIRPRKFKVQGRETRVIPFVQPGSDVVWYFQFIPIPQQVMDTLEDGTTWSCWAWCQNGKPTSITRVSFSQDSLALDTGSGMMPASQHRDDDNTHQWGMDLDENAPEAGPLP